MGDADENLLASQNFLNNNTPNCVWMSELCIPNDAPMGDACRRTVTYANIKSCREYYKRYDHEEIPVKDYPKNNSLTETTSSNVSTQKDDDERHSLTNSQLDRLEKKILSNVSQELQTESSVASVFDSNLKFFKTTVEQIFETFYSTMKDFDVYKERFHEILRKNKTNFDSMTEMEDFIKEMIHHIQSSDSLGTGTDTDKYKTGESSETKDDGMTSVATARSEALIRSNELLENLQSLVHSYRNENYLTDSSATQCTPKREEVYNIYVVSPSPCIEIKMNDRNMLSEININKQNTVDTRIASAEDLVRLAAKKRELEGKSHNITCEKKDFIVQDKEIPIRIASAKKNIYLNEDFNSEQRRHEKSLMAKICSFICRKLRRS